MRVVVCDDDKLFINQLKEMLSDMSYVNSCEVFNDRIGLWNTLHTGIKYDVIFMKIEWEQEENGIHYASRINQDYPDIQIIFVTSDNERFSQEICWEPVTLCGYLVKPVVLNHLQLLMDKAWNKIEEYKQNTLTIQCKGVVETIPFSNILYLESVAHQVQIHTTNAIISVYEKLDAYEKRLQENFLRIHKSYYANMDYIRHIERKEVTLQDGTVLPVSKSRYAVAREQYFSYRNRQV